MTQCTGPYKGNSNYAFTSGEEFLGAGGSWGQIEVRKRPLAASPTGLGSLPSGLYYGNAAQTMFQNPENHGVKPPSAVATSQSARQATTQNLTSLSAYELALSPEESAQNLSRVYRGRSDLQGLYNPDGTAKNPNDPRVRGIPTLADWANKYGRNEESLLKNFSSSPAVNAMLMQIQQSLSSVSAAGASLGFDTEELISGINGLTGDELTATASARTAADDEDYRSLDHYMKELSEIRKERDSMVAELLKNVRESEEELRLAGQLTSLDEEARNVKLGYKEAFNRANDRPIAMEFITGQQETALRSANLQLERIASEQEPVIGRLELAQRTRANAIQALQIGIQAIDQDSDMVFKLANFAQELAKTEAAERKAARDFAFEHPEITTPFYSIAGTVYKTDGTKAYSNEQSFFTDAGVKSFQEAYDRGLLMDVKPVGKTEYDLKEIGGIPYIFDKKTGELMPAAGFEGMTPGDPEANELLSVEEAQKLGVPFGTTKGEAYGLNPAATADQSKAAGYAARIQDAINNTFVNTFKMFENGMYSGASGAYSYWLDNKMPHALQPNALKQHKQAVDNFINATLRRESGATITPQEYETAGRQYIAKAGDDAKTIAQKKQNMNRVLSNFVQEAGSAWQQLKGGDLLQEFESLKPANPKPSSTTGMRTDRHNNPTAFITDIAKLAGLVEGVDYVKGDPFSNGKYHTARLLKDPIATTIKVLDRIGFKTSSGGNRWTYTDSIPETNNWSRLSYAGKVNVIKQMYKHEGGTQLSGLFKSYT